MEYSPERFLCCRIIEVDSVVLSSQTAAAWDSVYCTEFQIRTFSIPASYVPHFDMKIGLLSVPPHHQNFLREFYRNFLN